nr:hypothetical protein [Vaginimicrobium propionicum]
MDEVTQDANRPLPELRGANRVDAVANGNDGVQVVVLIWRVT